jgi:hypothetical protein
MIVKINSGFREIIKSIMLLYFIKFTGRQFAFSYFFLLYNYGCAVKRKSIGQI